MDLIIGKGKPIMPPCTRCGYPLQLNGVCNCKPKKQTIKKYSGKSKSEHAFGKY